MRLVLIISISWLIAFKAEGCDCKTFSKQDEFEQSDLVFIGLITDHNASKFEVKVLELFKGKINQSDSILHGVKSDACSIIPRKGETWLIYSNLDSSNNLVIDRCGYSRNFKNPLTVNLGGTLPPPPTRTPLSEANLEILSTLNKIQLSNELYFDIENLRQINAQKDTKVIKNQIGLIQSKLEEINRQHSKSQFYDKLILMGIILTIIVLIYLSIIISRKQ